MYVYLLRHVAEPRFKIGKANNIYQRIPGIGGIRAFNLASSLCLQLQSEDDAYRLEKILHRLFDPWNLPVNENNRYSGDTEQFEVECFDRVLKFLTDNSDLTGGASPMPIPAQPVIVDKKLVSPEEIEARKAEEQLARTIKIEVQHEKTLKSLETLAKYIEDGSLLCGIWPSKTEPGISRMFTCVQGDNEECRDFVTSELIRTYIMPMGSGLYSVFGGCSYYGGMGIHDYHAKALVAWDSEARPSIPPKIHAMKTILQRIPLIDDAGVFTLLRSSGLVDTVEKMGVDGLKDRIRRVMLYRFSGQPSFGMRHGSGSLENWILSYCVWGLGVLGVSEDAIRQSFDSISDAAKRELKKMKREEDPMWGYFIYKNPIHL